MEVLLTIFYISIFSYAIYKLKFFTSTGLGTKLLISIFYLKILSGVILSLIYTYYYKDRISADIFKFFDDGKMIYEQLFIKPKIFFGLMFGTGASDPEIFRFSETLNFWHQANSLDLYNDYKTMIRFNALACVFSFGHYTVHTVFMSFLSFVGLTALYKTSKIFIYKNKIFLIAAVYLVPSVMLWSSGVLKEGFILLGLGLFLYSFIMLRRESFVKYFIILSGSAFILIYSKVYILIAIFPGIVTYMLLSRIRERYFIPVFIITHMVFLLVFFNTQRFSSYNLMEVLSFKQQDFSLLVKNAGNVGSLINIPELKPDWMSFLINSPGAFINSLFRPFIFESTSAMMLLSAIENLIILVLIIFAIAFSDLSRAIKKPLFFTFLSFVVILFLLCGLTTPVLGALVRYKMPAMPFLALLFIMLINTTKAAEFFSRMKSKFLP